MNKPERTLLDAVDELSLPRRTANWQEDKLVRRVDKPLLEDLRDAIASNIGGRGGGKQARERTPMDLAAFELYERIEGMIRAWLVDLGARPGRSLTPEQCLRTWYWMWSAAPVNAHLADRFRDVLDGWADEIRDKLDPPKIIEGTAPCPACGTEWVNLGLKLENGEDDPNDVERVHAFNIYERGTLEESYAKCSACNEVWMGVGPMRQARIGIDDAAKARLELSSVELAMVEAFGLDQPEPAASDHCRIDDHDACWGSIWTISGPPNPCECPCHEMRGAA